MSGDTGRCQDHASKVFTRTGAWTADVTFLKKDLIDDRLTDSCLLLRSSMCHNFGYSSRRGSASAFLGR